MYIYDIYSVYIVCTYVVYVYILCIHTHTYMARVYRHIGTNSKSNTHMNICMYKVLSPMYIISTERNKPRNQDMIYLFPYLK